MRPGNRDQLLIDEDVTPHFHRIFSRGRLFFRSLLARRGCTLRQAASSAMKFARTVFTLILLLALCGCGDAKARNQIIGTWFQNTNSSVTYSADGSFISVFKGYPDGHTNTFQGTWSVRRGRLVYRDVHSNSVAVAASDAKILGLSSHFLELRADGNRISLTR